MWWWSRGGTSASEGNAAPAPALVQVAGQGFTRRVGVVPVRSSVPPPQQAGGRGNACGGGGGGGGGETAPASKLAGGERNRKIDAGVASAQGMVYAGRCGQ